MYRFHENSTYVAAQWCVGMCHRGQGRDDYAAASQDPLQVTFGSGNDH